MKLPHIELSDLVGYFFAAAVTVSCVRHLASGGLKQDYEVFRNRKWTDWAQIVIGDVLACSFLICIALLSDRFPNWQIGHFNILKFSWLDLLSSGPDKSNLMLSGAKIPFFGLIFVPLLFLNLPRLAAAEEESFRYGTKNWLHAIPKSLGFGLMHMVVGVPLWCGLALSVPGLWFTKQYFQGGVSRSTMAHSIYNMILATAVFAYVVAVSFHL